MKPSALLHVLALALTSLSAGLLMAAPDERPHLASPAQAPSEPASLATIDPTSEFAPPPFAITGPENLDHAIEQAKSIMHPAYKEKVRYHRSTHISFSLPTINGQDMSMASIDDAPDMQAMTEEEEGSALAGVASLLFQGEQKLEGSANATQASRGISVSPAINENMPGPGVRHSRLDIKISGH